jgi:hypothetical protein
MSTTDDIDVKRASLDLVRLKVDGASSIVNTIRDQQTARGLSLVCPFPALEAAIPVSFSDGAAVKMRRGTIHRIGVEDDPETGLPRLRLSVRAHETRSTVVAPPTEELLEEASRAATAEDSDADTDLDLSTPPFDVYIESDDDVETSRAEDDEVPELGADPAWVGCDELPLPEEFLEKMRTRRRRKLTGIAAWGTVVVVLAAGAYTLTTSDAVNVAQLRDYISGIVGDSGSEPSDPIAESALSTVRGEGADSAETAGPTEAAAAGELPVSELDELPAQPEVSIPPSGEPIASPAMVAVAEVGPGPEVMGEEVANTPDDITIMLPTRWRAEYANSYRLRDPNGVVVDVPGGLVRREGWLEAGGGHPMIRSVKAVQRETGARFIVFVHGELPRFLTAAKPGGIALRLFRESGDGAEAAEQVAMLP